MKIRWTDSSGVWRGRHVDRGDVVDVEDRTALVYVSAGKAELVPDEIRSADPVVEHRDPRPRKRK
jgi:hypothetical protein